MKNILQNLENRLTKLKEISNYRVEEKPIKDIISFSTNDYLNLSLNKNVRKAGIEALKIYGAGAVSSKFIAGYSKLYENIKDIMLKYKKADDCLVFNSGYLANIGIFQSLFKEGDIIFLDENSHASSFEGAKLSGAKIMRFKHNSIDDLKNKLMQFKTDGRIAIATEIVFSMQGTKLLGIEEYFKLAKQYNAILITDEAHSFGLFKINFPYYELHLQMGTFSKSVGVLGGYVLGNKIIIDAIRQFAKSGIYTTALPPSILASILASLKLIFEEEVNGEKALKMAELFCVLMDLKHQSQIVFIETTSNEKALKLSDKLQENGFFVKAIRSPTVKIPGIRLSFTNFHKKVDIKKLSFIIKGNI